MQIDDFLSRCRHAEALATTPQHEADLASPVTGKGPWKKRLPEILAMPTALGQRNLPEVGTQSVISEILAGKRQLNLRQVKALAGRFQVPMDVFA